MSCNDPLCVAAKDELDKLRKEYDEEVISHDIEEKDLKAKLAALRQRIAELEQQLAASPFISKAAYKPLQEKLSLAIDAIEKHMPHHEDCESKNPTFEPSKGLGVCDCEKSDTLKKLRGR